MKTLQELKKIKKELKSTVETAPEQEGIQAQSSLNFINKQIRIIQLTALIEKYTEKRNACRNLSDYNKYSQMLGKYEQELKSI